MDNWKAPAYSLKIKADKIPARAMAVIRKVTNDSFSNISGRIKSGKSIIEADSTDLEASAKLIALYEQLKSLDVPCEVFEGDSLAEIGTVNNWIQTMREIDEEMDGIPFH